MKFNFLSCITFQVREKYITGQVKEIKKNKQFCGSTRELNYV